MAAVTEGGARYFFAARSSTALAHVLTGFPLRAAAASYAVLRAGFSRSSRRSVSGSSMGGLPLPRFGAFMDLIMTVQITVDKPSYGLYSVRTLNQGADMTNTEIRTKAAKSDLAKVRKYGVLVICGTNRGNLEAEYENGVYTVRNFNNGEFIASGAPKAVLPILAASYVMEA